ncbi:unnamed protein product, partial [Brassica oleracea]
ITLPKCYYKFKELEDENCYIVINSFKWTFEEPRKQRIQHDNITMTFESRFYSQ